MSFSQIVNMVRRLITSADTRGTHGKRRLELVSPSSVKIETIAKNNWLAQYAKTVTSQDGEDGVLAEIFKRMGIAGGWCVEFGAWDGEFHANTWDLVHNLRWKAVYIEPHVEAFKALLKNCESLPDVYCFNQAVGTTGETSLDAIFARTPIPTEFDLLVIDIDGDDFYVWSACKKYRPKVVMIEFNPFIASDIYFVKPQEEDVRASASLLAVYELAKTKGYELICVIGGNAIFIRSDYFPIFSISDNHPLSMYTSLLETKIFQGYDGSFFVVGNRQLIWRHQINRAGELGHVLIDDEAIQVLPEGLRVFRPRLSYKNAFLDENAGRLDRSRVPSNHLLTFQNNITSECGEDGILAHVFAQLGITDGYCVEVGAFDGVTYSNTWTLIHNGNWQAVLIEKDIPAFATLQSLYADNPRVLTLSTEVTTSPKSSLDSILAKSNVPKRFDFLCIDVEGNDFNLWESLHHFLPKVVMVDFNPSISNDVIFAQEDSETINHGASLRALVELAERKGYALAAVTTWNAIFVHRDYFATLGISNNDIDLMYYPIFETKLFQSMNSYLTLVGCNRLMRHNYVFEPEQLQPIPPNVRILPYMTEKLGEIRSTFYP